MKFTFNGEKMVAAAGYIGEKAADGSFMDKINSFSDSIVDKEIEWLFKPIGEFIVTSLHHLGDWFIANLPDIMGYSTMAAAAFIIIGSMTGRGGMMKPLGWLVGGLIAAVCILGGV
ncbi:hypothetical protein CON99_09440 [Bacillus pseudomycoides]|nr:hypothetical protein CON99_09440 [Bacillus pseudomycoides]